MTGTGRMRILKVMPGIDPCAGAEQSFAATAPALIARGCELHLAVFTERQGLVPDLERAGGIVHDLSSCTSMWGRYRSLRRVVAAISPDLVHATLWDAVVPAQLAARRSRVPILVTWANVGSWARGEAAGSSWKLRVVHVVDWLLARLSGSHFHAVTEGVAQANAAGLGVPAERIHVAERGRPDTEAVPAEVLEGVRAELGIGSGDVVALCVGRQEPQKDHVGLVEATALAAARRPELKVLLAGREGHATPAIDRALRDCRPEGRVRLLGHRDDIAVLLELADLFVLPSLYEGAAGAVIEAMRAGRPIVATDLAGLSGILVDRVNALVVPVADREALARAMVELSSDPELRRRLGAAARRTYEQRFTLDRAVEGLESMYRAVLGAAGRAGAETR